LAQAMQDGGSLEQLMPILPKKAQMVIALAKSLGLGNAGQTPVSAANHTSSGKAL
jgi:hypothetical protein